MIDILYPARNRLAFTQLTFEALLANTDWSLVGRLAVYDDGSTDGTRGWLEEAVKRVPAETSFVRSSFGSPPTVMNHYVESSTAEMFAKVDNDIAMPPGWLNAAVGVLDAEPELELLGLAAGWTAVKSGPPGWQAASHIGGVGLMRTSAFTKRERIDANGRFGFTEWQHKWEPRRGWIIPDVLAVQLDLIPEEPFRSLAARYVRLGWQRYWPPMEDPTLWEWFTKREAA